MLKPLKQHTKKAYIALFAIACVLFLCWNQQSNWVPANCPLQAQHQASELDAKHTTQVVADCDASGHLLQQAHANILDGGVALTLFIALTVLALGRHAPIPVAQAPPLFRRYRPHLVFCVFNE